MTKLFVSISLGLCLALLSTFVVEGSATATYPEVQGCEDGCTVTATGWPLLFVRDYSGISVINTAHILEVWFGADRFDWFPFIIVWMFWSGLAYLLLSRTKKGQSRAAL
ncbi:MAG TPA: hypothetical protein VEZ41_11795 [Allosphingosinicella sp.]|nr:hypothetical protein [Allosphingosinicella sp.]